jgi:hypothetical protein
LDVKSIDGTLGWKRGGEGSDVKADANRAPPHFAPDSLFEYSLVLDMISVS